MNDNTNLKRLQKQLKENEQQNKNLIDSLKMCNVDSIRQSIFDEIQVMEQKHKEIEKDLLLESMQNVDITIPEIKFFLNEMRKGNVEDMRYRKMLVNTLINKVYLYDDNITFIFNSQSRPYNEKIPNIKELEEKLEAEQECSYKIRPAPPHQSEFSSNSFKVLKIVRLGKRKNMNRFIGSYFLFSFIFCIGKQRNEPQSIEKRRFL